MIFAFPFFYLINLDKAIYKGEAIYFFAKEFMLSFFFVAIHYFLKNNLLSKKELLKSVFIFSLIISAIAIVQLTIQLWNGKFAIDDMLFLRSTAANKNLLSMLLFFGTASAALLYFEERKTMQLIGLGVFTLLIILLQTRSVWFAMLLFIACTAPWKTLSANQKFFFLKKFKQSGVLIMVVFIVAIIFTGYFGYHEISSARTLSIRVEMWKNTCAMIADHFISGVGGGNWQIHFPWYGLQNFDKRIADGYMNYQRPHNDFLWIFSETGIGGILVFISIFFVSLRSLYTFASEHRGGGELFVIRTIAGCIAGFLVISFFDFPFERIEHREIACIFLAISSQYESDKIFKGKKFRISKNFLFVLVPFLFFCLYISFEKMNGEYHLKRMLENKQEAKWNEVISESGKSENYFFKLDLFSMPVAWYAGVAWFNLGNNKLAEENFEKAYTIHPFNIHVLNNLAGCYEKDSDHSKAISYYKKALDISPMFDESMLNLSAAYFNAGDIANAYESIQKIPPSCSHPNYAIFKNAIENKFIELRMKSDR